MSVFVWLNVRQREEGLQEVRDISMKSLFFRMWQSRLHDAKNKRLIVMNRKIMPYQDKGLRNQTV